ncbi:MAG: hypothetical protein E6G66_00680 [Actinobacteria bacterium]|nr:MAG: hypothetical protein E6G66_00680 [Actinomycetota bacterium]
MKAPFNDAERVGRGPPGGLAREQAVCAGTSDVDFRVRRPEGSERILRGRLRAILDHSGFPAVDEAGLTIDRVAEQGRA